MQAIPLVRASSVRPVVDFLEQTGAQLSPWLLLARSLLHDPAALLPISMAGTVFDEVERIAGREDFALAAGSAVRILGFGDWGSVLASCDTVGTYFARMETAGRRFNSGQRLWAEQRGDEVWLHQRFSSHLTRGRRAVCEFAVPLHLAGLRLATGPDWRPLEIHLEGAPPGHADQLEALATRGVRFERPHTVIVIPAQTLSCRYPTTLEAPPPLTPAPMPSGTFDGSIRQMVEALIRLGSADLSVAAETTHMSERSLQRRLGECGVSFTQLLEQVRFDSAQRLLRNPAIKIVEISNELGYTDSANFTRAFRRWSGLSPQAFRQAG